MFIYPGTIYKAISSKNTFILSHCSSQGYKLLPFVVSDDPASELAIIMKNFDYSGSLDSPLIYFREKNSLIQLENCRFDSIYFLSLYSLFFFIHNNNTLIIFKNIQIKYIRSVSLSILATTNVKNFRIVIEDSLFESIEARFGFYFSEAEIINVRNITILNNMLQLGFFHCFKDYELNLTKLKSYWRREQNRI